MIWQDRMAIGFALMGLAIAHQGFPLGWSAVFSAGASFLYYAWKQAGDTTRV